MIELYHGSLWDFNVVDVSCGQSFKDFGRGFYTTPKKEHADSIVKRNIAIARSKGERVATAFRYNFLFDDVASALDSDFRILEFKTANIAWLDFVISNRTSNNGHGYDLVIGPTADARTAYIIQERLTSNGYNEVPCILSDNVKLGMIQELKPNIYPKQYCFCTNKAIIKGYLIFKQPQWRVIL